MSYLNVALGALIDGLLFPFRGLPPLVGLTVVSLLAAIGILLAYKATSNQEKLAAVKRRIHAGLFEIRLFSDDLRAILRALGGILVHNLRYLGLSMVPMLWILPPLVLIATQLQYQYGYRPLETGARTLLTVALEERGEAEAGAGDSAAAAAGRPALTLETPAGLAADAPPVWVPSRREMVWRLAAERPGSYEVNLRTGDGAFAKRVVVADAPARVSRASPVRPGRSFLDQLLWPGERPLPAASGIRSIELEYPEGTIGVFGWRLGSWLGIPAWMLLFLVLSVVFAFALRNRFKVTI